MLSYKHAKEFAKFSLVLGGFAAFGTLTLITESALSHRWALIKERAVAEAVAHDAEKIQANVDGHGTMKITSETSREDVIKALLFTSRRLHEKEVILRNIQDILRTELSNEGV